MENDHLYITDDSDPPPQENDEVVGLIVNQIIRLAEADNTARNNEPREENLPMQIHINDPNQDNNVIQLNAENNDVMIVENPIGGEVVIDETGDNVDNHIISVDTPNTKKKRKRSLIKSPSPKKQAPPPINIEEDDGSTCSICLDHWEMSGPHRLISLKCGHLFGHSCIKRWIQGCRTGSKCCPSCKAHAALRDVRFIYAKRICAIDNTEEIRLKAELELVESKSRELLQQTITLKCDLHQQKLMNIQLQRQINDLKCAGASSSSSNSGVDAICNYSYKLFMEKNIEISKEPGCRVMLYGKQTKTFIISQKSSQTLFPGYGVRFLDIPTFKPSQFLHVSTKSVRDLCFNTNEDLLITASMDKGAKLFDTNNRNIVAFFKPTDNRPLWSCCFNRNNTNLIYLGSQHGSVFIYDLRDNQNYVTEMRAANNDLSPVINVCTIPSNNMFPQGGLLICKLQSIIFYELTNNMQEAIPTQLGIEGPFTAFNYDIDSEQLVISTRPNAKYCHARYIIARLFKLGSLIDLDIIQSFEGSKVVSVMSRCAQINVKDNKKLLAAYLQDTKMLTTWSLKDNHRVQSLPISDTVLDICPIYLDNQVYLGALTNCKCRIYKIEISSN